MGRSLKVKVSLDRIAIFLVYLVYIHPAYFDQIPFLDSVLTVLKVGLFLIFIFLALINKRVSRLTILMFVVSVIPAFVTFLQGGNYYKAIAFICNITGSILWTEFIGKKRPAAVVDTLAVLLELLIYANLLTIFLVPGGLYHFVQSTGWQSDKVWLFGLRNGHTMYLVLGVFFSSLRYYYSGRRMRDMLRLIAVHICAIVTVYMLESGGGYIVFALYYILLLICLIFKKLRIDFSIAILFNVVLFFLLTTLSVSMGFANLLALIGKDVTMSGRLRIWQEMWAHILEKPLFGYGYMRDEDLYWLMKIAAGSVSGHNLMIDIFFMGGAATYAIFVASFFEIRRRLNGIKDKPMLYNYATLAVFSILLTMQSEGGFGSTVLNTLLSVIAILPEIDRAMEARKLRVNVTAEPRPGSLTRNVVS